MFGWLDAIKIGAGLLAGLALFGIYDKLIDDPLVAREARSGYVLLSEKTAAEAQATELRRQRDASSRALEEHRNRLAVAKASEEQANERLEKEIAENEIALAARGRSCTADADDLDFILRDR